MGVSHIVISSKTHGETHGGPVWQRPPTPSKIGRDQLPCVGSIKTANALCTCKLADTLLRTKKPSSPPREFSGRSHEECLFAGNRGKSPAETPLGSHNFDSFNLEDTNKHVKTIMRRLIVKPQPSGFESGEIE